MPEDLEKERATSVPCSDLLWRIAMDLRLAAVSLGQAKQACALIPELKNTEAEILETYRDVCKAVKLIEDHNAKVRDAH